MRKKILSLSRCFLFLLFLFCLLLLFFNSQLKKKKEEIKIFLVKISTSAASKRFIHCMRFANKTESSIHADMHAIESQALWSWFIGVYTRKLVFGFFFSCIVFELFVESFGALSWFLRNNSIRRIYWGVAVFFFFISSLYILLLFYTLFFWGGTYYCYFYFLLILPPLPPSLYIVSWDFHSSHLS